MMKTQIDRNPFHFVGKLPITGFYSIMNHLAAMLGGASYVKGKGNNQKFIGNYGALDYALPCKDIYVLQKHMLDNAKATLLFTTVLLPIYLILSTLRNVFYAIKSVISTTLLHVAAPFVAIFALVIKEINKNKGKPYSPLKNHKIASVLGNAILFTPENPASHLGMNKKGFRDSALLLPTYQERAFQSIAFTRKLLIIPNQLIDYLFTAIDSNPKTKAISWFLFPLRLALSLINIAFKVTCDVLLTVSEAIAFPIVAITHVVSLIKYKAFREAMKNIDFKKPNNLKAHRSLEDLKPEDSTYKALFKNADLFAKANFVVNKAKGTASIEGGKLGNNGFKVTVTENNRATLLSALHHNAFGWASQLNERIVDDTTQLDQAVDFLSKPIDDGVKSDDNMVFVSLLSSSSSN